MKTNSWTKGPAEIENEVRMQLQLHAGSLLVVEGDDGPCYWCPRVLTNQCELVIGDGKPNVLGALSRLDEGAFNGVLGVVDDDLDTLE